MPGTAQFVETHREERGPGAFNGARPQYSSSFHCIGAACEDTCCTDWAILIDRSTYDKYQALPTGPLRVLAEAYVKPLKADADGVPPGAFARIETNVDNKCPFHGASGLCQIQTEMGAGHLSPMCATYPRVVRRVGGGEEQSLTLSCPEAARVVLLSQAPLAVPWDAGDAQGSLAGGVAAAFDPLPEGSLAAPASFRMLRNFSMGLLRDRRYPLWQRMLLLGIFVHWLPRSVWNSTEPELARAIREFGAVVDAGQLRAQLEGAPRNGHAQLDCVMQLAGLRLPRKQIAQRYLDTVAAFTRGIGHHPEATMDSLVAGYGEACSRWYAPFFKAHPSMLENWLTNTVLRTLFPFGAKAGALDPEPDMERQFALLTLQFTLIKGLLIGVAGARQAAFGSEDVVRTVQSAAKHFEHHPMFLDEAYGLLVREGLNDLRGLGILLRN